MAISCDPNDLAAAAKCFQCLPSEQKQWIDTYLLAVIAGGSTDPNTLALDAKCFQCIPSGMLRRIQAYLLCQIAAGGSGSVQDMQVAWTPTNIKLGEGLGLFTYASSGLTGITSLVFNQATNNSGFDIESGQSLTSISFPNLTSIDPTNTQSGFLNISGCPVLTSISVPLLATIGGSLAVTTGNNSLVSLSFPSLVSAGSSDVLMNLNSSLASVSLPVYVPLNGKIQNFSNNALNAASVNHILARCVANAGYVSGTVDLSGGTNAAPSGQGIADKATLIGRGCTVNTN